MAALGCLALSFATANPAAAALHTEIDAPGYCPRPGIELPVQDKKSQVTTSSTGSQTTAQQPGQDYEAPADGAVRVATYNAQLTRDTSGVLFEELSAPGADDATEVARLIQTVRPDVLVLTGIDVDAGEGTAEAFKTNYLAVGSSGVTGMSYPFSYTGDSNAGVDSGADLDRNGTIGDPGDALGYGKFPGQSSMIILSKYPIVTAQIRDFTSLPWNVMPDNRVPEDLSQLEQNILPLSSVSHWDIPIDVDGQTLHVLASSVADSTHTAHASARNHDQIRFWQDYIDPETDYIRDHRGQRGPLAPGAAFVIAGSLKADPDGYGPTDPEAISQLLATDAVVDPEPSRDVPDGLLDQPFFPDSPGQETHTAPAPDSPGETYRADYVLPSAGLAVTAAGLLEGEATSSNNNDLLGLNSEAAHHMVWADVILGE